MDLLVPEVISLILKLGAMMVLIKAGFMSLCHPLEERMALCQPANNVTMTCTGGTGHALSRCLLGCGIGVWLGTSGVAAPMSCTSQSAFCCISHSFASGGKSVTPPYGPWEHVPPQVWTDQSNSAATQDEAEDEAEVCVLCCQRRSTVAVCDECKEHYCNECIDTHTCGTNVVC